MTLPQLSLSLKKLFGNNNSGKRRVMEEMNEPEDTLQSYDLSGTAQPSALDLNLPEPDLGGELTPQSYDVRANEVISNTPEEEPNQESMWTRFGRALAMQAGHPSTPPPSPPPIETQQVEEAEGLPPVNPEMQMAQAQVPESANTNLWSSIGNALKEYVSPLGSAEKREEVGKANQQLMEEARMRAQGLNPEVERQKAQQVEQNTQAALQEGINEAQQNPMEVAVYGATDQFAKNPELQTQFREITGMDFTPEVEELTKKYEAVITGMDQQLADIQGTYDQQMARIKERIDSGNATDMDKYYVGLALLMPLLIGGIFGKEAGLGALGGAAKGIGDIYARRATETAEGEEALAGLNKERGNLALKRGELDVQRINLPNEIRKSLPKDEREFLRGKKEVIWRDPATGEERVGVEVKPGLVALPENITSKEELTAMTKEANEINEAKTATQLINSLTDDIIDISSKLKNKGLLSKGISTYLIGKRPDLASKLNEQVEFEGRKVNAGIVLEHKLKLLTDAYRQAKGMRALTNTVQEHIDGLFRNPAASFQNYEDTIDQMLYTRNLAQKNLVNNAANHGFAPEFLQEEFGKGNKKVYGKLNKKEEEKMSSSLLRE